MSLSPGAKLPKALITSLPNQLWPSCDQLVNNIREFPQNSNIVATHTDICDSEVDAGYPWSYKAMERNGTGVQCDNMTWPVEGNGRKMTVA